MTIGAACLMIRSLWHLWGYKRRKEVSGWAMVQKCKIWQNVYDK